MSDELKIEDVPNMHDMMHHADEEKGYVIRCTSCGSEDADSACPFGGL